jgi:hypothetical protein
MPSDLLYGKFFLTKSQVLTFLSRNLYERYPKDFKLQNSEYRGHQVSLKESESQNFSFLSFEGEAVRVAKNLCERQRRVTDGKKLLLKSCYLFIKNSKKIKSAKKFRFSHH